jgi:hypothetical protein
VDPVLPSWLPDIILHNLRFGTSKATLRFWKEKDETRYEVLSAEGECHVERGPAPGILARQ